MTTKEEEVKGTVNSLNLISAAFVHAQGWGRPKITQLYDAISHLVAAEKLQAGIKLQGEREIAVALGISLGTVQRSLNKLMTDGNLVREHGRGTFVRQNRHALHELWHYRFRDPKTQALLPVYAKVISRRSVNGDDLLLQKLGPSPAGYISINRLIRIDDRFCCWSEMYLSASRFHRLLDMPASDLESVNLKRLLDDEFAAPTLSVNQTIMIRRASGDVAKHLAVATQTPCLFLQIAGKSRRSEPVTFQQIYVPPVDSELELTESPGELSKAIAA